MAAARAELDVQVQQLHGFSACCEVQQHIAQCAFAGALNVPLANSIAGAASRDVWTNCRRKVSSHCSVIMACQHVL